MTFLEELVEQARKYGRNEVDWMWIEDFVKWCFEQEGKTPPTDEELEPYK